jgi:hypothetical protein
LLDDAGYVHFMQMYCGIHIYRPAYNIAVDVPGFTDASSTIVRYNDDFLWQGESSIFQKGMLVFCDAMLPPRSPAGALSADLEGFTGAAFGFQPAQTGIFRVNSQAGETSSTRVYCDTFIDWLTILVSNDGYFPI